MALLDKSNFVALDSEEIQQLEDCAKDLETYGQSSNNKLKSLAQNALTKVYDIIPQTTQQPEPKTPSRVPSEFRKAMESKNPENEPPQVSPSTPRKG